MNKNRDKLKRFYQSVLCGFTFVKNNLKNKNIRIEIMLKFL